MAVLSAEMYNLATCRETEELISFLENNIDSLDEKTRRITELRAKDLRELKKIPAEEYIAYTRLINEADDVWHRAKVNNDYKSFEPYIDRIVETQKRFASLIAPEKDPYDYRLDKFEEGLTKEKCEKFFDALKKEIVPLVKKVCSKPQVNDEINRKIYPVETQRKLSDELMKLIGIDRNHCTIAETEHPFTTHFTKYDVRITTHYHEDSFLSSMFSVIHEGGHALYELNVSDEFAYTCLDDGISMGVHECQSRFFENIIGRSEAFSKLLFPVLRSLFPQQTEGFDWHDLYLAANKSEPSLIRTEADELTYALHIMVRFEIEKMLFEGKAKAKDLPEIWNRLYKEYLGIDVPDDRRGVLQDSHWSGGMFGYFPSYALGSAYGAQMLSVMEKDIDVFREVENNNIAAVNKWLTEHVWQYGSLYKPGELIVKVFGKEFDPTYYTDYLKKKFSAIYGLN